MCVWIRNSNLLTKYSTSRKAGKRNYSKFYYAIVGSINTYKLLTYTYTHLKSLFLIIRDETCCYGRCNYILNMIISSSGDTQQVTVFSAMDGKIAFSFSLLCRLLNWIHDRIVIKNTLDKPLNTHTHSPLLTNGIFKSRSGSVAFSLTIISTLTNKRYSFSPGKQISTAQWFTGET